MQHKGWDAGNIAWQETAADGSRYALLDGNRESPGGIFTYAFAMPAGFFDPPHSHSQTARVFVAMGTLWLGYGPLAEPQLLRAFPAGSLLIVPAGALHFDGSYEETLIFGCACGPWSTRYLDPGHAGSSGTPAPV